MYFQFANKQKEMMMIIREPSESKEQISFIIKFYKGDTRNIILKN